jgi:hypothetical protein
MKKAKIILLWVLVAALMSLLLYFVLKADDDILVPAQKNVARKNSFDLRSHIQGINAADIVNSFPYKAYLDSSNYDNILFIKNDLVTLDSLNPDIGANRQLFAELLTNKLYSRDSIRLAGNSLDSLIPVLQWAVKFSDYAEIDITNRSLFRSVHSYWINIISNKLADYSRETPSIKYQFKFRYLVARCEEFKFFPSVHVTSSEKVVFNITHHKWAHLFSAAWDQTSLSEKLLGLFLILSVLYGYVLVIRQFFSLIKKNITMKKNNITLMIMVLIPFFVKAQDFSGYVETKSTTIDGTSYIIEKMSRKEGHVKAKYFACKEGNTLVANRYDKWATNKKVIAISSGTYMNSYDLSVATPVGLCIDNGEIINRELKQNMDGLVIVYATGGIVASNLKEGNLKIRVNGKDTVLDILRNSMQLTFFMDWAEEQEATVFQAHLFVYKNQQTITEKSKKDVAPRRFLAVCQTGTDVFHYIINLPTSLTLYDGSTKAFNYLQNYEHMNVVFMINLDTGKQDVLKIFDPAGMPYSGSGFSGALSMTDAANLLVYYYE